MDEGNWLLLAYKLHGDGKGTALDETALMNQGNKDLSWVHLNGGKKQSIDWLKSQSDLDEVTVSALVAKETRPRALEVKDGCVVILRGVNLNENAEPEDMVSLRAYVTPNRIITVRIRRVKAVLDLENRILAGTGPKSPGDFIQMLVGHLCDRMEPSLSHLHELTDNIEEDVIENPNEELRLQLIDIRKQAIIFRRYLSPQKDVLNKLRIGDYEWLNKSDKLHLSESYDRILRHVEDLDAVRERTQIVQDELLNILTSRLNKDMYLLSIMAALFLPLGFFTGLFGVNLGGIPGAENGYAFGIFCLILVFIVGAQTYIFKSKKWM